MLKREGIRAALQTVQETYSIKSVQLFGSYAEGREAGGSDIDLLVDGGERGC